MLVDAPKYSVESKDVARFLSGSDRTRISKSLQRKVVTFNQEIIPELNPTITYHRHAILTRDRKSLVLAGGTCFTSPKLARTMRPCSEVVCFLATIGSHLDRKIAELSARGRMSSACVLDAMGSLLVESVVENFQQNLSQSLVRHGLGVTLRFSPGYCDWPLIQQRELFPLLRARDLGVRLSAACLMTPRKSISGVFGIHALSDRPQPYIPCWDCGRSDCTARRARPRRERDRPPTSPN